MMNKRKTPIGKAIKYLLAVPIGAVLLLGNAIQASDMTVNVLSSYLGDGEPLTKVEQMPVFPGGDGAQAKFISENLKYPVEAQKKKLQGRVIVGFVIKSTGDISDIKVVNGIDPLLDNEAMRVIKAMPKWEPGKQDGKAVDVYYTQPFSFLLKGVDSPKLSSSEKYDNEVVVVAYSAEESGQPKIAVARIISESNNSNSRQQMPSYPGGEQAMIEFIKANLKYPEEAVQKGIEGRVNIRLVVEKTGELSNVEVVKGVDPTLDAEAVRVVKSMPKWNPGIDSGEAVAVYFNIPIMYNLNKDAETK